MKLATWNVNSLKVRLSQVIAWTGRQRPDVLCLQETKLEDGNFPAEALRQAGYQACYSGQKTYNGVAIVSLASPSDTIRGIPGFEDPQRRVLATTIGGVRIINIYVPNGESVESDKYQYKLRWLAALTAWLRDEISRFPRLAVLGDFNIAPEPRDVHDPAAWEGKVLFSKAEREAFQALLALGLKDCFRLFEQTDRSYTWWDYRMNAFRRKMGMRIYNILLSDELALRCSSCSIDTEPRGAELP